MRTYKFWENHGLFGEEIGSEGSGKGGADGADGADGAEGDGEGRGDGDTESPEKKSVKDTVLGGKKGEDGKGESDDKKEDPKSEGDQKDGEEEDGKEDEGKKGDEVKGEFSEFTLKEGFEPSEEWLGRFTDTDIAKELTQSNMQELLDLASDWVSETGLARDNALVEHQNAKAAKWLGEWEKSDAVKEAGGIEAANYDAITGRNFLFGGDDGEISDVIDEMLNTSGLGNHPTFLAGLARATKLLNLQEAKLEGGGQPKQVKPQSSRADRLFSRVAAQQRAEEGR